MSDTVQIFNDAISAVNNRDLKRAEELFRGIIKTDESHIAALNLLVVVLMSMKRFAEAEQFIARATSLNQQSDVSFYNYGLISKHLNKPQQALENFSKAIALNPDIAETWNNRGTVLNDLTNTTWRFRILTRQLQLTANIAKHTQTRESRSCYLSAMTKLLLLMTRRSLLSPV